MEEPGALEYGGGGSEGVDILFVVLFSLCIIVRRIYYGLCIGRFVATGLLSFVRILYNI